MPKISPYSDNDILTAIKNLHAQGKHINVAAIAELVPVNRNRIQKIMMQWQKGVLDDSGKVVEIPEVMLQRLRNVVEEIVVQTQKTVRAEFQSKLEEVIALQHELARDRDTALKDVEEMRAVKELAEKLKISAQTKEEEALKQADQARSEAKNAEERAVRADERVKLTEDIVEKVTERAERAEKNEKEAENSASLAKQNAAEANAIAAQERILRERAEAAQEKAELKASEQTAIAVAAKAKEETLTSQLAETAKRAERAEHNLSQAGKDIAQLRYQLSELKGRYEYTQESLRKLESDTARYQGEIDAANRRAEAAEQRLAVLLDQLETKKGGKLRGTQKIKNGDVQQKEVQKSVQTT